MEANHRAVVPDIASREGRRSGRGSGSDGRREIIIAAAHLFAGKGFVGTSMRTIASEANMTASSLYYHFKSKEALFVAVHAEGVQSLLEAVSRRLEGLTDPWERLEAAAAAHVSALFESADLMVLLMPKFPDEISAFREELVAQRDSYESIIRHLIADLKIREDIDREVFRLHLIGALNWTQTWYRPGFRLSADEIGRQLVRMIRPSEMKVTE